MTSFIKYIGPAHVRQITALDWRSIGIQADTVIWAGFNGWSVAAETLTEDQIRKAIEPDPQFVIVGQDEAPKANLTPSATPESAAAGEFDITDDADRERAQETVTEAGQVDDKTPASTSGGAPSAKASR